MVVPDPGVWLATRGGTGGLNTGASCFETSFDAASAVDVAARTCIGARPSSQVSRSPCDSHTAAPIATSNNNSKLERKRSTSGDPLVLKSWSDRTSLSTANPSRVRQATGRYEKRRQDQCFVTIRTPGVIRAPDPKGNQSTSAPTRLARGEIIETLSFQPQQRFEFRVQCVWIGKPFVQRKIRTTAVDHA